MEKSPETLHRGHELNLAKEKTESEIHSFTHWVIMAHLPHCELNFSYNALNK